MLLFIFIDIKMISFYLSDKIERVEQVKHFTKWLLEFFRNLLVISTITFFAVKVENDPIKILVQILLYIAWGSLCINTVTLLYRVSIRFKYIRVIWLNYTVTILATFVFSFLVGKIVVFIINTSIATFVFSQLPHVDPHVKSSSIKDGYFRIPDENSSLWFGQRK